MSDFRSRWSDYLYYWGTSSKKKIIFRFIRRGLAPCQTTANYRAVASVKRDERGMGRPVPDLRKSGRFQRASPHRSSWITALAFAAAYSGLDRGG